MDAGWANVSLNGIALIASAGAWVYAWHSNRQRASREEIEVLKGEIRKVEVDRSRSVGELKDRTRALELELEHLPSKDSVHEMGRRIGEIHGDMGVLAERIKGVSGQLETMNNFLLKQDR